MTVDQHEPRNLLAALGGAIERERTRRRTAVPCPACGGDPARRSYTPGGHCHLPLSTKES